MQRYYIMDKTIIIDLPRIIFLNIIHQILCSFWKVNERKKTNENKLMKEFHYCAIIDIKWNKNYLSCKYLFVWELYHLIQDSNLKYTNENEIDPSRLIIKKLFYLVVKWYFFYRVFKYLIQFMYFFILFYLICYSFVKY